MVGLDGPAELDELGVLDKDDAVVDLDTLKVVDKDAPDNE
jgi:hypothetical protein